MIDISINGCIIKAFKENHYDVLVHGNNCFCNWGRRNCSSNEKKLS